MYMMLVPRRNGFGFFDDFFLKMNFLKEEQEI